MKRASKFLIILLLCAASMPAYALVDINTATPAELDALKGIGPAYAARIIAYRSLNGPFRSIEDIQNVKGIGPVTFAGIKGSITVGNVASAPKPVQTPKLKAATAQNPIVPQASAASNPEPMAPRSQLAAAGEAEPAFPLSAALMGVAGLVGLGAWAAWWAREKTKPKEKEEEVAFDPEEFIIE